MEPIQQLAQGHLVHGLQSWYSSSNLLASNLCLTPFREGAGGEKGREGRHRPERESKKGREKEGSREQ